MRTITHCKYRYIMPSYCPAKGHFVNKYKIDISYKVQRYWKKSHFAKLRQEFITRIQFYNPAIFKSLKFYNTWSGKSIVKVQFHSSVIVPHWAWICQSQFHIESQTSYLFIYKFQIFSFVWPQINKNPTVFTKIFLK